MEKLSHRLIIKVEYLPTHDSQSLDNLVTNIDPMALTGLITIVIRDKVITQDKIAILKLLKYCHEWELKNQYNSEVKEFNFQYEDHSSSSIIQFKKDNKYNGHFTFHFYGGAPLAKVLTIDLINIIGKLKRSLIDACLKEERFLIALLKEMGIKKVESHH